MNKMKKLLSVVLAVIMALSCMSVMASAAKAKYQSVADLNAAAAYSPYGQVTRLSSEERASMIQDFLDNVLPGLGINMGEVFNVLGLSITLDLTSVDRLCYSLDTVKSTKSNFLYSIAAGIVDLGVVETLDMGPWQSGITRAGSSQLVLFDKLLDLLAGNTNLVKEVLTDGLDLGIIGGLIGNLDLSSINNMVKDLPSLVKGLIFPLIERWDDSLTLIKTYDNRIKGDGNVENTVNERVKKLFSDNMSITTVKYDKAGTMTSEHTGMPIRTTAPNTTAAQTDGNAPRCVYVVNGTTPGSVMTVYHIADTKEYDDAKKAKDKDPDNEDIIVPVAPYAYVAEKWTYTLLEEVDVDNDPATYADDATYVWKSERSDDFGNTWTETLKWYNDNSPFLPGFSGDDFDLTTMSAGDLLYTFIPVVFENMAPVVLNGSLKKILAEFFGATFKYVGQVGEDAVNALPDASNAFFTEEQGEYLWEWSNYAVINGNHYYRFEDQIFAGDISRTNNYFDIINWDYEITGDFMNEFIPDSAADANDRMLLHVSDFLTKVAKEVVKESAATVDEVSGFEAQWTFPTVTYPDANNAKIVDNVKAFVQAIVGLAPQHLFGSDYETNPRCYVDLMLEKNDDDLVLTGIAAQLVDIIMPSMTLPTAEQLKEADAKVGAILAAVVREFAAVLTPEYNYDALIYADYGTTTADPVKTFLSGKDSTYWLNLILSMGVTIGYEYLRAFADMGEGSDEWNAFLSYSGYNPAGATYGVEAADTAILNGYWKGMLDYLVDWALDKDYEWTWKMENLVNTEGLTIDMATYQDPGVKLDHVLGSILPVSEILTVEGTDETYPSKFEKWLLKDLILGIVDLEWANVINTIQLNGTNKYFRTNNVLDQAAKLLKGIVNPIFAKVGGGSFKLIPDAITDFDSLANHANIRTLAVNLVGALDDAYDKGLLDTAFPIVGFFLGWQTNPQKLADPQVWTTFRDSQDYAFQWTGQSGYPAIDGESTKIHFLNNSSGMLEKHRNTDVVDHAYDITIKEVKSDATVNTLSFNYGDGVCSPWETLEIKVGGTYKGEEAVTVTIGYDYVGKDGQPIGGRQYTSVSFFISNQYEDSLIEGRWPGDEKDGKNGIDPFKTFHFTEDIYTTVTEYRPSIWGTNETLSGTSNWKNTNAPDPVTRDCNGNITDSSSAINMTGYAAQYFEYYQNKDGGWPQEIAKDGSGSGKLYKAKQGVTADTEFQYGAYDMGQVAVKYGDDSKVWSIDFIYYNDYDIGLIYEENKLNGYHANQGVDAATYNEYNAAWKDIVKLSTYPMMTTARNVIDGNTVGTGTAQTDYVSVIMPQIEPAIARFEAAKEAYLEALAEADASASGDASASLPSKVEALGTEINDNNKVNGKEIDYGDYEFYEYFNYADTRTEAMNVYNSYLAPEVMDTYYILNSGIREAELNNVIAAEDNDAKAAGIAASRLKNDQAAIDASVAAKNDWKMPTHTNLVLDDLTARLLYYKSFLALEATKEANNYGQFLDLDIAHIDAQQLNEADYEEVTWGRFKAAYDYAKEVQAGTAEYADYNQTSYKARHDMLVYYKELLKNADSLIQDGGTADLEANITKAEAIFELGLDAIELSEKGLALATDPTEAKNIALGHLIQGLGYYYVGEDGNTWNLYADSAYEYADNDRPNKQGNQAKVDACNANLEACIAYFATEEEPNTYAPKEDAPFETLPDATNNVEGTYTGTIYGFDTMGLNLDMIVDGAIADFVTSQYGPDYVEIISETGVETTGTTINILDKDRNVVESYVFILFGDVDMDGWVGGNDAAMCEFYDANLYGFNSVIEFMAADVDGDAWAGGNDAAMMEYFDANMEMPSQADIGAVNVNNYYELIIEE